MSAEQAERYRFRAVVLKEKKLAPDIEGIPYLESDDGRVFLEFHGYPDPFIRYRLVAETLWGCSQDNYSGSVLAAIVYTDKRYQDVALPLPVFKGTLTCQWSNECLSEINLTNLTEEDLNKTDSRLVLLAPFTLSRRASKQTVLAKSQAWKQQILEVFPEEAQTDALNVLGLFLLHRFAKLTYAEIKAMLNLDLMNTVAGQQLYEKGALDEARFAVLKVLKARFKRIAREIVDQVNAVGQQEVLSDLLDEAAICPALVNFHTTLKRTLANLSAKSKSRKSVSSSMRTGHLRLSRRLK